MPPTPGLMVLGVDPGQRTGVAVVRVTAQTPYDVVARACVSPSDFVCWVRDLTQSIQLDGVALETWEWQGPKKSRGVPPQAFAAGRVVGALEVLGVRRVALLERTVVRQGLTGRRWGTEAACHQMARAMVRWPDAWGAPSLHEWDAICVALIGAGRLPPIVSEIRRGRSPQLAGVSDLEDE